MKENELLREVRRIVTTSDGLTAALARIQFLFAGYWGGALLIIRPASTAASVTSTPAVSRFLESRDFPFRGLYTEPLNGADGNVGMLVACIGTSGVPGDSPRRIISSTGQLLADLARRVTTTPLEYVEAA